VCGQVAVVTIPLPFQRRFSGLDKLIGYNL